MNRTKMEWVENKNDSLACTWNPISYKNATYVFVNNKGINGAGGERLDKPNYEHS